MNAFFMNLVIAPYIWMCRSGTNNRIINRLYEKWSRFSYNDKQSASIHMRNIQSLAIEISGNLSYHHLLLMIFSRKKENSRYYLRQNCKFSRPLVKSVYHGSESVSFIELKIWDMLPDDFKDIDNLKVHSQV